MGCFLDPEVLKIRHFEAIQTDSMKTIGMQWALVLVPSGAAQWRCSQTPGLGTLTTTTNLANLSPTWVAFTSENPPHFPFLNSLFTSHIPSHILLVCAAQLPTCPLPGIDCW